MKTFIFDLCFECANTGTIKTINKEYKAINKKLAYSGFKAYCDDNNTMINYKFNLLNENK